MKIERIETLHADGIWRNFDFVKLVTDTGVVGWSEYNEHFGGAGVTAAIRAYAAQLIGTDARAFEAATTLLQARGRVSQGGVTQQAIAAIENALIDAKARALGIPVYELFGGPVRERIRLYWSHCGTYRVLGEQLKMPVVRTYDDVVRLGREVVEKGWSALKTNVLLLGGETPSIRMGGFGRGDGFPDLNADRHAMRAIRDTLAAFREGAGPDTDLFLDLNWNFRTEGFREAARAMAPFDVRWVELDTRDAKALAGIRASTAIPIASGECLFGRRDWRPFLEAQAMDVAIVDIPWNGFAESLKIAAMAEAWELNVAPHNFYGHLSTAMSAHFAAVVPNLRIMEVDPDVIPWHDALFTAKPDIRDGWLHLSSAPGWGIEIDEAQVRAHPPAHPIW
jgi:L-alanine-DL-glutamate epimerase-like enolase superfamily enzyme